MAETSDTILQNALKPKSVSGDSGSMSQFSIAEQIQAAEYAKKAAAANKSRLAIRFAKIKPGGPLG